MPKAHQEVPCHKESPRTDVTGLPAQKPNVPLTVDEAKTFLTKCTRDELNDHAFGDSEVAWFLDGKEVASGYFGATSSSIGICHGCQGIEHAHHTSFKDADARALRYSGVLGRAQRNDSAGPDTYVESHSMSGLTLGDLLRKALTLTVTA